MDQENPISKLWLEKALKTPITKFKVKPGSELGDGYTCAMYSVEVWMETADDDGTSKKLIVKALPSNPARQELIQNMFSFEKEFYFYELVIPELQRFLEENDNSENGLILPFPEYVCGRYEPLNLAKEPANPLDNFILMSNLKENGGYRLWDRYRGFDLDHCMLFMEAYANLHAVSWAYKIRTGTVSLQEKFPALKQRNQDKLFESMREFVNTSIIGAKSILKDRPELFSGIDHLHSVFPSVVGFYFGFDSGQAERGETKDSILRVPVQGTCDDPWSVALHGDAWSNNLMFRYDSKTHKPVQIKLVDLQITQEGDPMTDICYCLYTSTTSQFRQKHLQTLLYIYYDTFSTICDTFQVPYLPGWGWEEFNRRFNRTKIFGAYMSVIGLPMILKDNDELVDLDKDVVNSNNEGIGDKVADLFTKLRGTKKEANSVLKERLGGVLQDLIQDGVL